MPHDRMMNFNVSAVYMRLFVSKTHTHAVSEMWHRCETFINYFDIELIGKQQ